MFHVVQFMLEVVNEQLLDDHANFVMHGDGSGGVDIETPHGPESLFQWDHPSEIYLHFGYWLFDGDMPEPESVMQQAIATTVRGEGEQIMLADFQHAWIVWLTRVHDKRKQKNASD